MNREGPWGGQQRVEAGDGEDAGLDPDAAVQQSSAELDRAVLGDVQRNDTGRLATGQDSRPVPGTPRSMSS